MQIVKESIFISAIRSFFNALLAMVGVLIGLVIIAALVFSFSPSYQSSDEDIVMEIMPDEKGNSEVLAETTPAILRIDIHGVIGDAHLNGELVESFLRASRRGFLKNDRVKAVLLNINSPGGTVIDSDIIYKALLEYKKRFNVPIYAYTSGLCASGGYYIACASEKINSSQVAIIGSVGTKFGPMFNFWDLMQKYGVDSVTLTDGKYKEKFPSFSKLPEGKNKTASYQDLIEITSQAYEQFIGIVLKARLNKGLNKTDLIDQYGARVFMGPTAQTHGYVDDGTSSYNETLNELLHAANIDPDSAYQVVRFSHKKSPIQDLVNGHLDLLSGQLQESILGIPRQQKWNNKLLYHYDIQNSL